MARFIAAFHLGTATYDSRRAAGYWRVERRPAPARRAGRHWRPTGAGTEVRAGAGAETEAGDGTGAGDETEVQMRDEVKGIKASLSQTAPRRAVHAALSDSTGQCTPLSQTAPGSTRRSLRQHRAVHAALSDSSGQYTPLSQTAPGSTRRSLRQPGSTRRSLRQHRAVHAALSDSQAVQAALSDSSGQCTPLSQTAPGSTRRSLRQRRAVCAALPALLRRSHVCLRPVLRSVP